MARNTLSLDQLTALQDYAAKHGRAWKAKLNEDWMYAKCNSTLMGVRNQFGPSWLVKFRLYHLEHTAH